MCCDLWLLFLGMTLPKRMQPLRWWIIGVLLGGAIDGRMLFSPDRLGFVVIWVCSLVVFGCRRALVSNPS